MVGPLELVIILLIVLLIFGAGKLPAIGDALGRSIKNFRRSSTGVDEIDVSEKKEISEAKRAGLSESAKTTFDEAEVIAQKKGD